MKIFGRLSIFSFAGVILGGLFEEVESPLLLYGVGFIVIIVFLYLGYYFLKREFR